MGPIPGPWRAAGSSPTRERPARGARRATSRARSRRLSAGEEHSLALAALGGDRNCRRRLIEEHLWLAEHIARRYVHVGVPYPDLVQEGAIGLIRAVDRFDPTRGIRLSTYASWWIRQTILRAIGPQGRTIRVPTEITTRRRRVIREAAALGNRLGRAPTTEEVAMATGLEPDDVADALDALPMQVSLDSCGTGVDSHVPLVERLPDSLAPDPAQAAADAAAARLIRRELSGLGPQERTVITRHYGLSRPPETLDEIGASMHLTRERVRQIEQRALSRLSRRLRAQQRATAA